MRRWYSNTLVGPQLIEGVLEASPNWFIVQDIHLEHYLENPQEAPAEYIYIYIQIFDWWSNAWWNPYIYYKYSIIPIDFPAKVSRLHLG